jgi:hypothetical protein
MASIAWPFFGEIDARSELLLHAELVDVHHEFFS